MSMFGSREPDRIHSHEIILRVRFNKPVTRGVAQKAIDEAIGGKRLEAGSFEQEWSERWECADVAKNCKAK